jgi:MSHA biogenesis protein MshE
MRGRGCNYCQLTGYRGRIGVYELLEMDGGLTDAMRREDLGAFVSLAAKKKSYVPLVNCALEYATSGVTSLDEVLRVAGGLDAEADTEIGNAEMPGEVADD